MIRFLVTHARCTECGGDFRLEDVHVLGQKNAREWDLGAVCHGCHTLTLIRAVVRPEPDGEGAHVPAIVLDERTKAERRRFAGMAPVTEDEVLDMAAFLSVFDGDFRDLFAQEPDGA